MLLLLRQLASDIYFWPSEQEGEGIGGMTLDQFLGEQSADQFEEGRRVAVVGEINLRGGKWVGWWDTDGQ